jgi:hypothetical protein
MKIINISEEKHKAVLRELFKEVYQSNQEPFASQDGHGESIVGKPNIDKTTYGEYGDNPIGWNDDEPEGYEEDIDWQRDDVTGLDSYYPSDYDLGIR